MLPFLIWMLLQLFYPWKSLFFPHTLSGSIFRELQHKQGSAISVKQSVHLWESMGGWGRKKILAASESLVCALFEHFPNILKTLYLHFISTFFTILVWSQPELITELLPMVTWKYFYYQPHKLRNKDWWVFKLIWGMRWGLQNIFVLGKMGQFWKQALDYSPGKSPLLDSLLVFK